MLVHEKRFFATVIDIGIVLILSLLINLFIPSNVFNNVLIFTFIYFVVGFTYMFLNLLISKDRTIGLYVMALKLLGRDWGKPSTKVILLRSIVNSVLVLHLVNIFYILFNKTTDTLFDEVTDSFIVQTGDAYRVKEDSKESR